MLPDFGMMGDFRPELRDGFMEACIHLVNRDFKALAKDFVTLGYSGHWCLSKSEISTVDIS